MIRVTVVDYSNGNANAVIRAVEAAGGQAVYSRRKTDLENADCLVMPGVGHAGTAMAAIEAEGLRKPLEAAVLERKVPVLGICLGMQLMTGWVEEGNRAGLGWIEGRAVAMRVADTRRYKVPHIGWNTVHRDGRSRLFADLDDGEPFYFCHKYEVVELAGADAASRVQYEGERVASFEKGNIFGVQFHPEKSHEAGLALFCSFLKAAG